MTDLTPNHPADKVAARALCVSDEAEIAASEAYAQGVGERPFSQRMRVAIIAALPHLTADDLRDTPAGRALMAEPLEKVLALHPRVVIVPADPEFGQMEDEAICGACIVDYEAADWPCPNVRAITTALNGDPA